MAPPSPPLWASTAPPGPSPLLPCSAKAGPGPPGLSQCVSFLSKVWSWASVTCARQGAGPGTQGTSALGVPQSRGQILSKQNRDKCHFECANCCPREGTCLKRGVAPKEMTSNLRPNSVNQANESWLWGAGAGVIVGTQNWPVADAWRHGRVAGGSQRGGGWPAWPGPGGYLVVTLSEWEATGG